MYPMNWVRILVYGCTLSAEFLLLALRPIISFVLAFEHTMILSADRQYISSVGVYLISSMTLTGKLTMMAETVFSENSSTLPSNPSSSSANLSSTPRATNVFNSALRYVMASSPEPSILSKAFLLARHHMGESSDLSSP